jgi:U3 small nucleolar RNA-associated protein 5
MPEYNLDGPTIGEKLATLALINRDNERKDTDEQTLSMAPPSADSIHILLKQALRADDNMSLLTCLYNRDEKVSFPVPIFKTSVLCWLYYYQV